MILQITFNGVPDVNDTIGFKFYSLYPLLTPVFNCNGIIKSTRVSFGEIAIGTDTSSQAYNYHQAFLYDYGSNFSVFQVGNIVYIEALNGSDLFDYTTTSSVIEFNLLSSVSQNNAIHEIIFTPKIYAYPAVMNRNYLITEDDYLITTEDGKKIRL